MASRKEGGLGVTFACETVFSKATDSRFLLEFCLLRRQADNISRTVYIFRLSD